MNLSSLLRAKEIRIGFRSRDKEGVIREMVEILAQTGRIRDSEAVVRATLERERQGSTGLEDGVAVPHCKTDAVSDLVCSMGISPEGIDFDALDKKPSHLFFFLASPTTMSGPHVKALAGIARICKSGQFRSKLQNAQTPEEAIHVIAEEEGMV